MPCGNFKVNYEEDMAIFQTIWIKFWMILLFLFMLVFPWISSPYILYIINLAGIAIIGATGLNLLSGYTGQISLGHAAFLGIGAYLSAILNSKFGIPFPISMICGGVLAAVIGLVIAIPSLRLRGLYLAIATMAFSFIIYHIIFNWNSMTGGPIGMNTLRASILGYSFNTDRNNYYLIYAMAILAILCAKNMTRSKIGRAWMAIRDRDISAEVIGISLTRYKVLAFFVSSFYAGIAGALSGHYLTYIAPPSFGLMVSIQYIAMIIVGGMGTILGSIFGAVFIVLVPEFIRLGVTKFLPQYSRSFGDIQLGIYGLIIVLFLLLQPEGLYRGWNDIKKYFKSWPYTY